MGRTSLRVDLAVDLGGSVDLAVDLGGSVDLVVDLAVDLGISRSRILPVLPKI